MERELTAKEKQLIRRLVKDCANYDSEYGCLPLDCPCYILSKVWTGAFCKYFAAAVLPTSPALMASLSAPAGKLRDCPICGTRFEAAHREKYCSPVCVLKGAREKDRKRKQKQRRNGG